MPKENKGGLVVSTYHSELGIHILYGDHYTSIELKDSDVHWEKWPPKEEFFLKRDKLIVPEELL